MPTVAVISEGRTDQQVLFNILRGVFPGFEKESFNPVQPKPMPAGAFGGWALVLRHLSSEDAIGAFQYADILIIQIDTDDCEEIGFDVSRRVDERERTVDELREAVRERLIVAFGSRFAIYKEKIAFAICVDATECWLLPLFDVTAKTSGCLKAIDHALKKRGEKPINDNKDPRRYDEFSRPLGKRRELEKVMQQVRSLELFVEELRAYT